MTAKWTSGDVPGQQGRLAVVTGANTGLGFEAARVLAARGPSVVLAVRDTQKATQARARPAGTTGGAGRAGGSQAGGAASARPRGANVLFPYGLQRRLPGAGTPIAAAPPPGLAAPELPRHTPAASAALARLISQKPAMG